MTNSKMENLNLAISIIILNVNGLNTPIKRATFVRLNYKVILNYILPTKKHL